MEAAELLLLMDLALENPLELDVRLPSPRGIASKDSVGSCDVSCVGVVVVDDDDDDVLGLNLSRNDLLPPDWFSCGQFGGAPGLDTCPEVETFGAGSPDVPAFLAGELLLLFEATGMDLVSKL
jgi:hypothetical protein